MKKKLGAFILVLALLSLAGCASVQRKFTRKPKVPEHTASVIPLSEGPYQKKFSNEFYYQSHFTLWKNWQTELIQTLGENRKKVERAAQESLGNLTELKQYLLPEKQAELAAQIEALTKITDRVNAGNYSASEIGLMKSELEKIRRIVAANFYYNKVKDQMVPERVDLVS